MLGSLLSFVHYWFSYSFFTHIKTTTAVAIRNSAKSISLPPNTSSSWKKKRSMKHAAKNTRYTTTEYMIQLKTCRYFFQFWSCLPAFPLWNGLPLYIYATSGRNLKSLRRISYNSIFHSCQSMSHQLVHSRCLSLFSVQPENQRCPPCLVKLWFIGNTPVFSCSRILLAISKLCTSKFINYSKHLLPCFWL